HLSRSRSRNLGDFLDATPLGRYQEQRFGIRASEHASEAPPVEVDHLQHPTTFAYPDATPVGNVSVPDGVVGVEADPIGDTLAEVGPHPAIRKAAVLGDVERGKPFAERLGDDQR